jgi:nucleotide-binding universal stress UspA family protein
MATVFQRLLLATERTEFDAGAERLALALARHCATPLGVVMPLLSNPEFEAQAPALAERAEREAATRLLALRQQAEAAGIAIDLRVRRGAELWREIVDEAHQRSTDLLVLRRRGRRGFLARLLVGEMVSQVLAHAPCCALVVPRDAQMWTRRVLVAAEPGEPGLQRVALATSVASACALPLGVVCVAGPGERQRSAAADFLAQAHGLAAAAGVTAGTELRCGEVPAQLLDAARDQAADLLVLGAGRGRASGVTHQVTGATTCAVLIVPPAPTTKEPPR